MDKALWEAPGFLYLFRLLSSKRHLAFLYVIYTLFLSILFVDSIYVVDFPWPVVAVWLLFVVSGLYVIHRSYRQKHSVLLTFYLISCTLWWAGAVVATGGAGSPLFHYAPVLLILGACSASMRLNLIKGAVYVTTLAVSGSVYAVEGMNILTFASESVTHLSIVAFGCLIAVAMKRYETSMAHWQYQAHTDYLTGLANRQGWLVWWENQAPTEGWIGIIDLNNFKTINDTHGHEKGDRILMAIAQELQQSLPSEAFAARIGGDEFMIFLPSHVTEQRAAKHIKQLMQRAGKHVRIPVTAALGLARVTPDSCDFQDLYRKADGNMYKQKKNHASFTVDATINRNQR